MKTISIVIRTMKDMHLTGQRMGSIVELAGHAGVAELVSGHLGDRTAKIAERWGVRHGLHTRDRVARSVSVHVLLWRRVVAGLAAFPAWFICAPYRLLAGCWTRGFVGDWAWRFDEGEENRWLDEARVYINR